MEDDRRRAGRWVGRAMLGLMIAGCGAASVSTARETAPPPAARPMAPRPTAPPAPAAEAAPALPADRADPPPAILVAEMAAAEAAYLRAMDAVARGEPNPSVDLESLYAASATTDALRAIAAVRIGDLHDAIASRALRPAEPPPGRRMTPEVRDELERRLREEMAPDAARVYCMALASYRRALRFDPRDARARAQLDAYGPAFAASCDATDQ